MAAPRAASLVALPPELIDAILSHLSAHGLSSVSATCRALRRHALSDLHWHRCLQECVPGQQVTITGPCPTFRHLFASLDRFWFLPKYRIWFSDRDMMGKLIIVRYDQRRACIEGYQLLAASRRTTSHQWRADPRVTVHPFEPELKLHLDKPILQFNAHRLSEDETGVTTRHENRFANEISMALEDGVGSMFSNFLLTRPLHPSVVEKKLTGEYPYGNIWPPPTIPARDHVSSLPNGPAVFDVPRDEIPRSRCQLSDQTFRIRRWMEMAGSPAPPRIRSLGGGPASIRLLERSSGSRAAFVTHAGATGVHIGEEIITFSTLDPTLYTPTESKPWRGIWVGYYSSHGCEFLLINQPDNGQPLTDSQLGLTRGHRETEEAWETRRREARRYRGRLEAIKLTGDPNVPRGEYAFVASDLGPDGFLGLAADFPFHGVRMVRSKGHVAATGFVRGKLTLQLPWPVNSFSPYLTVVSN